MQDISGRTAVARPPEAPAADGSDRASRSNDGSETRSEPLSRRRLLQFVGLVGGVTVGLGRIGRTSGQSGGAIPTQAGYAVQLTGATAYEQFTRTGELYVLPPRDVSGANFDNGQNPLDIGLVSGNPPAAPETGAIWFATNNSVFDSIGLDTTTGDALIDIAFVTAAPDAGTVTIELDPAAARVAHLNTINARGGLTENVYQLLEGTVELQFTDGGQTVAGTIDLVGQGFIEPGPSPYQAVLEGSVASA